MACLQAGDEAAWAEFVRRFHPLIARVAFRVARQWGEASPEIIEDLIQETYLKLCENRLRVLQSFKSIHKNAIYGYIKVFTANLVHDHFKIAQSQKRGRGVAIGSISGEESSSAHTSGIETSRLLEREVLIQEINVCLQLITSGPQASRDRRIFWLYYRAGLPANAIAALPAIGLSTKGVESTLLRLSRQVRQRLVAQKQESSNRDSPGKGIRPAEAL